MNNEITLGCPVADGELGCGHCGGHWPGTFVSSKDMAKAINNNRLQVELLGCGPLQERATKAIQERQEKLNKI